MKQGLVVLFMPCFILSFYVLFCLSTFTVSICIGVVGSGMLAYYALAEARAVGWEGMQGSVEDVEIFGHKSFSERPDPEDFDANKSTV